LEGDAHSAVSGHYRFRTERVYLPRRAVQIVIHGHARDVQRIHWTFAHQDAHEPVRRSQRDEPQLPL